MTSTHESRIGHGDHHQPGCTCDPCQDAIVAAFATRLCFDQPAGDPDVTEPALVPRMPPLAVRGTVGADTVAANPDLVDPT
jgi:hypothetical protein